ncbi:MAG TPA: methyl-accepting chemotaxis protein, partial [Alphaproteobacteria bacterium]|nr:methyl-accepting chemotaxis protein [Alphaproteobacteria bacterium]
MKGRLSGTLWMMVILDILALFSVFFLAYSAGAASGGLGISNVGHLGQGADMKVLIALVICLGAALFTFVMIANRVIAPVKRLSDFSERLSHGDFRAKAEVEAADDFGFIAENLNRAAESSSRAMFNQEAQESLQKSVTEFLTIVSQIARGDLTLRGRVTNDALGNVVDSVNYMMDNFVKVLERVRKAAVDVQSSANEILIASEEMSTGAVQQDQEITNTSSAVEELTVSMKQVSNNAEASAEAARRALDAAEQGNRSVRDTLEGMQRIRSSVQATAKRIKALGDRSLEISEIVNVINDITEQTNLLALNAAIEAARAGEAGRGF